MDNLIQSTRSSGFEFPQNLSASYRVVTKSHYQLLNDDNDMNQARDRDKLDDHDMNQARDRDKLQSGVSGDL